MASVIELPDTKETQVTETKIKNVGTVSWLQQSIHRSRNEVFSEIKTITPGLAEFMLSNNHDNRRVRPAKLAQMVSDMKSGRWSMNGEPIIIAKTGELNDGQHRLQAVVQSKTPVQMIAVFGVDRETRTTVDQGANRNPGDYLQMRGVVNAGTLAAITRQMIAYERTGEKSLGRAGEITAAEVMERAESDITLPTSARYAERHGLRMRKYATKTAIGFCHNVLLSISSTDGMAFMEMLCTGEGLQRDDPAFRARERLLNLEVKSISARIEIIFRAWNAYREKRPMRTIPIHGRLPELV